MSKARQALTVILISLIISVFYIGAKSHINLAKFQSFINNLGVMAPIVFVLIYCIAPVLFIPITPLSITAGALFGPLWGTIISVLGANTGASITFLLSRYLLKSWADQKSSQRVIIIQKKIQEHGWKFVSISRLIPIFPFNLQNYLFGITDINFRTFFFASLLGVIPGAIAYSYLGFLGKNALSGDQDSAIKIFIPVIFIILISMFPYIIKKLRRA